MRILEETDAAVLVELPDGSDMWMTRAELKAIEGQTDPQKISGAIRYSGKAGT